MDNLTFTTHKTYPYIYISLSLSFGQPIKISYQHATKTILLLNTQSQLFFIQYNPDTTTSSIRNNTQKIQQLQGQNILLLQYIVDTQSAVILTQNGKIMTINQQGIIDIKAQNDDGISGGSLSPQQQYLYVVTKNNTLIQLDMEFDLVKQIPLDDHQIEKVDSYQPNFSWKPDGSFFAINILTDKGRKCHTRDNMLGIFRSPSKSDVQVDGLVQSVSQKSRLNMSSLVAWQPSGGIIAGSDYINKQGKKINRVIFWQKNGLRHLQFQLSPLVTDVLNLTWSPDSQILAVQILNIQSQRWLYLYHRSNYHWYLKHPIFLQNENIQYILTKKKHNQILIINKQQIEVLQYTLQPNQPNWLTQVQQQKNATMLQTCIDGSALKITDFSMGLIPPPMAHCNAEFQGNLCGVSVQGDFILAATINTLWVAKWKQGNLIDKKKISNQQFKNLLNVPINLRLISIQPTIKFTHNNQIYQINPSTLLLAKTQLQLQSQSYKYALPSVISNTANKSENSQKMQQQQLNRIPSQQKSQQKTITVQLNQQTLSINNTVYTQHCTSYIFYHQFLIFTVASSNMYDKMFILDFALDQLNNVKDNIKIRLQQFQAKKLLNYRAVERGAKIIGASRNRVVFQLPRGNLQGIYPKVITIKYVSKCLQRKLFKQAFQTIRTHKLDLNLLYDINPQNFTAHAQQILLNIKRTDYLNLFVSQLKDNISFQLPYCKTQQQIDQIQTYIEINLQGKKVKQVCQIVSKTLRKSDKNKYILSIFTSEIKMGKLNQVLFQIKDMKANDIQIIVPPHLQQDGTNKKTNKKQLNSQQILEYVCWLVDANAIYQASLLTYDIELASMTARCTQMDPKQYIPYLQQLKTIIDPIQLKKRICLDLKKYQNAVEQLSKGNQQQIKLSIQLIKKHKLFKCGLKSYNNKPKQLKQVKLIVIDQLLNTGQNNQAYKLCLSIQAYDKALQIAVKITDGSKIKQVLQNLKDKTRQERIQMAKKIMSDIGQDGFKNKSDLAKLKAYVGLYNQATIYYIRSGNYQKAYKNYLKSTLDEQITQQFKNGMLLQHSLQKNQLLKQKSQFIQKLARLHKVHKNRSVQGPILNVRNLQNDDMYSQISMSSKAASQYTISTTTGLRKKRDKKRSILSRNVKQGSPLQQQYLVAFLTDLLNKTQPNIKQSKLLIQHLIYINLIAQAQSLRNICKQYAEVASKCNPKFYAQVKFQSDHPQYLQLLEVYENKGILLAQKDKGKQRRDKFSIDSFNYMF